MDIDTFDVHWARLIKMPDDSGRWYHVMEHANDDRIAQIVGYASSTIPLGDIATGPADEMGLGPEYSKHGCLDFVLQDLGAYPGHGWDLIKAGIKSPVVRNRNMALNAIEGWGKDCWPNDASQILREAMTTESDDAICVRMKELVAD